MSSKNVTETAGLREQYVDDLEAEFGPEWEKTHQPGSVSCHELLDRTALLADNVEKFIVSHPACVRNKEWFALAERAANALHQLYQRVGTEHLDRD